MCCVSEAGSCVKVLKIRLIRCLKVLNSDIQKVFSSNMLMTNIIQMKGFHTVNHFLYFLLFSYYFHFDTPCARSSWPNLKFVSFLLNLYFNCINSFCIHLFIAFIFHAVFSNDFTDFQRRPFYACLFILKYTVTHFCSFKLYTGKYALCVLRIFLFIYVIRMGTMRFTPVLPCMGTICENRCVLRM